MKKVSGLKKYALPAVIIAGAVMLLTVTGIGCPIRFATGVSCPGCGMTRAWESALHLDFHSALGYHPLFWAVPVIGILVLFRRKISKKVYNILIAGFIGLFVIVYLLRLFDVNDRIVTYNLKDSALWRIVNIIKGGISQW